MPLPPPVSVLTEFHPQHLRSANANMSGYAAISGGTTRQGGFFPGGFVVVSVMGIWFGIGGEVHAEWCQVKCLLLTFARGACVSLGEYETV